jgi:hypothetical protein
VVLAGGVEVNFGLHQLGDSGSPVIYLLRSSLPVGPLLLDHCGRRLLLISLLLLGLRRRGEVGRAETLQFLLDLRIRELMPIPI